MNDRPSRPAGAVRSAPVGGKSKPDTIYRLEGEARLKADRP